MDFKKLITPSIFLILLLGITGFNNYNGALDKVGFQWLYLSVLNIIMVLYFLYDSSKLNLKPIFKTPVVYFFASFLLWSLFSFLYAYNITESLLVFSRWFLVFISVINVTLLFSLSDFRKDLFLVILLIVLLGELYFSGSTFLEIITITNYDFSYANLLKGVTGNKNITASVLCFKLPLLFYSFYRFKNFFLRIFIFCVTVFNFLVLYAISSRAMIIAIFSIFLILTIYLVSSYFKSIHSTKDLKIIFISTFIPLIVSISIFQAVLPQNQNINLISRVSTINTEDTSTSSRLRFYNHALTQLQNNPIIGVGIGNWKFESQRYDQKFISGYTVPYHVHNDFLEIATELGLPGMLLYLAIFLSFLYILYKSYKIDTSNSFFYISLFLCATVYFIDSNLNFPYARVINQVLFIFLISVVLSNYIKLKTK